MGRRDDDDDVVGDDEDYTSDRKPRRNSKSDVETESHGRLRSFIERIERLEEEKATIGDDIKDVYGEAKGEGYDTKAMRTIVKMRKKDQGERKEEELVLNTYLIALGMAPLGDDDNGY